MNHTTAWELAYGKGALKKMAMMMSIIETLWETTDGSACYLKLKEVSPNDYDEETETEYLVRFGYLFRAPRSVLVLHINKKTHALTITKEDPQYGSGEVESQIINYVLEHKKRKNLFFRTNWNFTELEIK